jgi:homogentisate phytyltransferase/homogentisate geranylgeranyltransferase
VGDLVATVIAGLTVNIAIVGINQITDVEIDRINKPFLRSRPGCCRPERRRWSSPCAARSRWRWG